MAELALAVAPLAASGPITAMASAATAATARPHRDDLHRIGDLRLAPAASRLAEAFRIAFVLR